MNVLITGITGMVGSHLAEYLLRQHPDVRVHGLCRWRSPLDNIAHLNGLSYARTAQDAVAEVDGGRAVAAFFTRGVPVEQVREVAAAGESMPPKSTYFFPKVLTGMVFNLLEEE